MLHNYIVGLFDALPSSPDKLVDGIRATLCSRQIMTEIYRAIIVNDVLPRMIDKRVLARYIQEKKVLFDGNLGVPVEFRHGAFRFAHSIVREQYKVNNDDALPTTKNLTFNSQATPENLPLTPLWLVDWARFFDTPHHLAVNLSKVIGPHYSPSLLTDIAFPPLTPMDSEGLANRDLISACYSGMLSVPAMSAKFATMFEGIVPDFGNYKDQLRKWLNDNKFVEEGQGLPGDLEAVIADPPLPFFVLFEAEQLTDGKRLGPVGSIIVAETIFGAIYGDPTGFEAAGTTQRERVSAAAAACFPDRMSIATSLVANIPEVTTMPMLLAFMASVGSFPNTLPPKFQWFGEEVLSQQKKVSAMTDKFEIDAAHEKQWGLLVRGWARGISEFAGIPYDKISPPRTIDELKAQCNLVGIKVKVPTYMTALTIAQHSPEVLVITLPSKKLVEDALAEHGQQGFKYSIPTFYDYYCGPLKVAGKDDADKFQALRIGDYAAGQCM